MTNPNSHAWAVIMAGGSGTRFWPLSRRARPKQLLSIGPTSDSLLRATARRIGGIVPPERIVIVTSSALADATAAEIPEIPRENVLAEPKGRNTAPCVGWAAAFVARRDPDAVMMVLPADHHIGDEKAYVEVLERALDAASEGDLVTVGLRPTRAETGYGYVELGEELAAGVHRARRFVEKPNQKRAEQFLAAGNFLWNSGMFFFRARSIREAIRVHLPGLGTQLDAYDAAAARGEEREIVEKTYADLPSVSIDHGVMEKAERVSVVPGSFGWSDLGSWTTAWELAPKDDADNAVTGDTIAVDARGCYVRGPRGKKIAIVGVTDLVVVDTEDALLVVPRDRAQDVRRVVQALEEKGEGDKY